jgi:3-dehydroquinate synthase
VKGSPENHSSPIWVDVPGKKYPIWIGYGLLMQQNYWQPYLANKQVFILTHAEIADLYLTPLLKLCREIGVLQVQHFFIPSGDQHKSLESAQAVWSSLLEHHYHRDTVVIALGGGMVGDLAGFCAACYMRGVDVIQCPTTLLAQIDAAIGGKTAVNHPHGKNMIGAFHQPHAVMIDLATLTSLNQREYVAGLAEMIKYGIAMDADFFAWLETNWSSILSKEPTVLTEAVSWSCRIKAHIVSRDEKEQGLRIVLNFGHTTAHAIESLLNYEKILHGEAVALGMLVAAQLSIQQKTLDPSVLVRLRALLQAAGLPTKLPQNMSKVEILSKMKHDKKHVQQQLQWVLLSSLGESRISQEVSPQEIEYALQNLGVTT